MLFILDNCCWFIAFIATFDAELVEEVVRLVAFVAGSGQEDRAFLQ